jgi:hypothetical protein
LRDAAVARVRKIGLGLAGRDGRIAAIRDLLGSMDGSDRQAEGDHEGEAASMAGRPNRRHVTSKARKRRRKHLNACNIPYVGKSNHQSSAS